MNFDIEEIKELSGDAASIYSVTMEGEETTLLEQFFDENAEYEEELNEILNKLYVMGQETGCRWDNFTHNEGSPGDGVSVLDQVVINRQRYVLTKKMLICIVKLNR